MTLIDKAEALLPCPFCGEVPEIKERGENIVMFVCTSPPCKGSNMFMGFVRDDRAKAIAAWNRRTAPAPTEYTLAPHLQKIVDGAKTTPQWDMQADRLAPTDAVHVNETPKAEHDADNVLTAAQAREAALREAAKVGADAAFNYWAEAEKPVSQRKYGGAGLPASVSLAILALIGDNNNDK